MERFSPARRPAARRTLVRWAAREIADVARGVERAVPAAPAGRLEDPFAPDGRTKARAKDG